MRRNILSALGALCLLATGACTTTLNSGQPPASGLASGFAYQLPVVTYSVEVSRELKACPTGANQGGVQFDVSAKAVSAAGPGETVLIDYASLANYLKTTDITFETYPNGLLKSVNAQVDDRTAAVIKAGVDAAVGIGKLVIGNSTLGGAALSPTVRGTPFVSCTPRAAKALAGLPDLKDAAKAAAATQKAAQEAYDSYAKDNPAPRDANTATELEKRAAALRVAKAATEEANSKVAKALASITLVSRLNYAPGDTPVLLGLADAKDGDAKLESIVGVMVPGPTDKDTVFVPITAAASPDPGRAVVPAGGQALTQDEANLLPGLMPSITEKDVVIVARPLTARPAPAAGAAKGYDALAAGAGCSQGACGLIYRTPAPARLRICNRTGDFAPDPGACWSQPKTNAGVLFDEERGIPQLGVTAALPLKNRPFEGNVLTAEFSADGVLTKFGYKKPSAGGEGLAQSAGTVASGLASLVQYDREEDLRKLKNDKILADAEAAAKQARAPLQQPSAVTTTDNETALLLAQKRKIDAEIALEKAKADLAAAKAAAAPQ